MGEGEYWRSGKRPPAGRWPVNGGNDTPEGSGFDGAAEARVVGHRGVVAKHEKFIGAEAERLIAGRELGIEGVAEETGDRELGVGEVWWGREGSAINGNHTICNDDRFPGEGNDALDVEVVIFGVFVGADAPALGTGGFGYKETVWRVDGCGDDITGQGGALPALGAYASDRRVIMSPAPRLGDGH